MTEEFNQLVDGNINRLIEQGVNDFYELILALPGVYPSVALQAIKRLNQMTIMPSRLANEFIRQSKKQRKHTERMHEYKTQLPLPHPLDFEWRFSDTASEYLLNKCEELTGSIDNLIMLGTPSLLRYSNERRKLNYKTYFMGDYTAVTAGLEKFCIENINRCNVFYEPQTIIVGSHVILDPPWYDEFIRAFMWTAKQSCTLGGYLLVSLPAIGTRPGVIIEWQEIIKWANDLGLVLIGKEDCVLTYSTPFFELNALHAEGIYNVPPTWRKGNLFIFMNMDKCGIEKPIFGKGIKWVEATIGRVRFKVKTDNSPEFTDPSLETIIDGDVLPSVSRKDERRDQAVVWTSGNRIYQSKGPAILYAILTALENGKSVNCAVASHVKRDLKKSEVDLVSAASQKILQIINIENKEYDAYSNA